MPDLDAGQHILDSLELDGQHAVETGLVHDADALDHGDIPVADDRGSAVVARSGQGPALARENARSGLAVEVLRVTMAD